MSRPTIFATALRPAVEPVRIERIGDGGDVLVQAALRDERAGEAGKDDERYRARQLQHDGLHGDGRKHAGGEKQQKRDPAVPAPRRLLHAWVIEPAVEAFDQGAHPHDRMLDAIEQRGGIAEASLDQKSAKNGDGVER